ncbi:MAG: hypothetical protein Q4E47_03335 [Candidatus Saccharibacteria bacterium]|nr:hypothetical protein [Candidatus Saccharibacteria bacterium]
MARTSAINITNGDGKDSLAESYGKVIESVQKGALSEQLKNKDYSGDPTTGSVEVSRFKNATSKAYGTARSAGNGDALDNSGKVTINLDQHKEIIEEIEGFDARTQGVENIIAKRKDNHAKAMIVALDKAFFTAAEAAATAVTTTETEIEAVAEAMIQAVETTTNAYVEGVDRADIEMTLSPAAYGKLRNYIDKVPGASVGSDAEEIAVFHGVRVYSNVRQTAAILVMASGAVAQPVSVREYADEKINLSDAHAVELFYDFGTKVVAADLVKKLATLPTPSA